MADPVDIWKAHPNKHEALAILWPALAEALNSAAGLTADGSGPAEPRTVNCAIYLTHAIGDPRPAAGKTRATGGHPVCADCAIERGIVPVPFNSRGL